MRSLNKRSLVGLIAIVTIIFSLNACAKKEIQQLEKISPPSQKQWVPTKDEGKIEGIEEGEVVVEELKQEKIPQAAPQSKQLSPLQKNILAFESKDLYFEFDDFSLSQEAKEIIIGLSSFLMKNPSLKVRIEGHCDERGTTEYNLALGERRAKSVQDYLIFLGVSPKSTSTISYGEEKPLDPRSCEEAWILNRRAHFDILE